MKRVFFVLFVLTIASSSASGHQSIAEKADIALVEKLGQLIPADAVFTDEEGKKINLKNFIDKPTIVAPIYLGCTHDCPLLLTGLADVISRLDLVKPGKDFQVITLSFDNEDTPKIAAEKKVNYLKLLNKPFPAEAWKFLTGNESNIKKFTDSIGFKFQRDAKHEFSHPIIVVVLGPSGKIIRYIEGTTFLPFEITMAITEAAEGRVGSPVRKALLYCFSYDTQKKTYVFNVLQVTGVVMILCIGSFLTYLLVSTKKKNGSF